MCDPRRHSRGVQQSQSRRQESSRRSSNLDSTNWQTAHDCSSMKTSFLTRCHWNKSLVQRQSLFVCQGIIFDSRCEGLNSARRGESQTREIPIWSAVHYTTTWLVQGNARLECTTNKYFIATCDPSAMVAFLSSSGCRESEHTDIHTIVVSSRSGLDQIPASRLFGTKMPNFFIVATERVLRPPLHPIVLHTPQVKCNHFFCVYN
jgi:hypothetical protein